MTLEVETIVAASLMMAVFSAVAAVGTSIVLGAGFERLRAGFEVVRKQTGFFSDAIHKLEQKVCEVDEQTNSFTKSISILETKVSNVGEQTNAFSESMNKLEEKVEVVDKQTGFFGNAIHDLEKKIDTISDHEGVISDKIKQHSDVDLISTKKTEALVSHAEDLLNEMSLLAYSIKNDKKKSEEKKDAEPLSLHIPKNLSGYSLQGYREDSQGIH